MEDVMSVVGCEGYEGCEGCEFLMKIIMVILNYNYLCSPVFLRFNDVII
jgi:hypothetical protein